MSKNNGKLQLRIKAILQEIIFDLLTANKITNYKTFIEFLLVTNLTSGICKRVDLDDKLTIYEKKLILSILNDYRSIESHWYPTLRFDFEKNTIKPRIKDLRRIQSNLPSEWKLKWCLFKIKIKQFIK